MARFLGHFRASTCTWNRPDPGCAPGLTDALREAVRTGRLAPGTRLPSSRSLAADLGIARNTVADAYAELVAEGWLTARQGSGTRVAPSAAAPAHGRARAPRRRPPPRAPRTTCMPGIARPRLLPARRVAPAARRALTAAPHEALRLRRPARPRRTAHRPRRLPGPGPRACAPTRSGSSICSGFAHGLTLLGAVLRARGRADGRRRVVRPRRPPGPADRAGLRTAPLPVRRTGHRTGELAGRRARRRAAHPRPPVPDWACRCTATGGPPPSTGRAPPAGWSWRTTTTASSATTASRSAPCRASTPTAWSTWARPASPSPPACGWAGWCCPPALVDEVAGGQGRRRLPAGVLDQLTLAEFIASGRVRPACARRAAALPPPPRPAGRRAGRARARRPRSPASRPGCTRCSSCRPAPSSSVVQAAAWQGLAVRAASPATGTRTRPAGPRTRWSSATARRRTALGGCAGRAVQRAAVNGDSGKRGPPPPPLPLPPPPSPPRSGRHRVSVARARHLI